MNFLAHCALAQDAALAWSCSEQQQTALLAGAVVGDFVKGRLDPGWPHELRAGVQLHRRIDALCGESDPLRQLNNHFSPSLRRYAPIFVDLLLDHALSHNWQHWYDETRTEFGPRCYQALDQYRLYLPPSGDRFATYMQRENLLAHYDQWMHIERAAGSVLRRLDREHLWPEVQQELPRHQVRAAAALDDVVPAMREHWQVWNAFEATAAQ